MEPARLERFYFSRLPSQPRLRHMTSGTCPIQTAICGLEAVVPYTSLVVEVRGTRALN